MDVGSSGTYTLAALAAEWYGDRLDPDGWRKAIQEMTRVLASDEFQGRSMGTAGEEKTVAYLIEQFHAAGLEPGGENGGWTQTVPLIRTQLKTPVAVSVRQAGRCAVLRAARWSGSVGRLSPRAQ